MWFPWSTQDNTNLLPDVCRRNTRIGPILLENMIWKTKLSIEILVLEPFLSQPTSFFCCVPPSTPPLFLQCYRWGTVWKSVWVSQPGYWGDQRYETGQQANVALIDVHVCVLMFSWTCTVTPFCLLYLLEVVFLNSFLPLPSSFLFFSSHSSPSKRRVQAPLLMRFSYFRNSTTPTLLNSTV